MVCGVVEAVIGDTNLAICGSRGSAWWVVNGLMLESMTAEEVPSRAVTAAGAHHDCDAVDASSSVA